MDQLTLQDKQHQFHEFFTIKHKLSVNLKPLPEQFELPDVDQLEEHMPYAFKIGSEMADIESKALRPLRNLGDHASELAEFLNQQSRKIDLMMSYILHQQDEPQHRFESIEFGGGGVVILTDKPYETEQLVELKIFLSQEAAAVFCYAEVIACKAVDSHYHVSLIYNRIREQDQELLVRASLHLQTLQLRQRSKQNKNETN